MSDEMTYEIVFDSEKRIIRLTAHGRIVPGRVGPMAIEAIEVSKLHGCPYLLIDYGDAVVAVSNHAIFEFMSGLEKIGLNSSMTIAVVYSRDEDHHRFAETVARNRGWYGLRYFDEYGAAGDWIREKQVAHAEGEKN